MTERRYTLDEIDALRAEIRKRNQSTYPSVFYSGPIGAPMAMTPESRSQIDIWERKCEDQLRTAMVGGAEPPILNR